MPDPALWMWHAIQWAVKQEPLLIFELYTSSSDEKVPFSSRPAEAYARIESDGCQLKIAYHHTARLEIERTGDALKQFEINIRRYMDGSYDE